MDYEALKDQWNDAEERDGVRLSWNTFPSTRMVRFIFRKVPARSMESGSPNSGYRRHLGLWSPLELYTPH